MNIGVSPERRPVVFVDTPASRRRRLLLVGSALNASMSYHHPERSFSTPPEQSMPFPPHAEQSKSPSRAYSLSAHGAHDERTASGTEPALHAVQSVEPTGATEVPGHSLQFDAPTLAYFPTTQGEHVDRVMSGTEPLTQFVQSVEPTGATELPGHTSHTNFPCSALHIFFSPAPHGRQKMRAASRTEPLLHGVHTDAFFTTFVTVSTAQGEQASCPAPA